MNVCACILTRVFLSSSIILVILQDPSNGQFIKSDERLKALLGTSRFKGFGAGGGRACFVHDARACRIRRRNASRVTDARVCVCVQA
jgi:hypothetical protein